MLNCSELGGVGGEGEMEEDSDIDKDDEESLTLSADESRTPRRPSRTQKKYDIPYDISTIHHNVFKNVEIIMFFRNKVDQRNIRTYPGSYPHP